MCMLLGTYILATYTIFFPFVGVSSRDLSPVDYVREYWSDCKDEMVEDMERIYVRLVILYMP